MPPRAGLRLPLYLDRFAFARKPFVVSVQRNVAEDARRARDLTLYVDSLQPETGYPTTLNKLSLELAWRGTMTGADIRLVNDMIAIRGPFDVCLWEEVSEAFFLAAGVPLAGYLPRRNALTVVSPLPGPPGYAAAQFAVTGARGDGTAFTPTLGTPDADGVTPWTVTGTSVGETVVVRCAPVYRMRIISGQPAFESPHKRTQTLGLEEM